MGAECYNLAQTIHLLHMPMAFVDNVVNEHRKPPHTVVPGKTGNVWFYKGNESDNIPTIGVLSVFLSNR